MKTALITGISGQDGSYLSAYLLSLGYSVHGTTRCNSEERLWRLHRLGILQRVYIHTCDTLVLEELESLISLIRPDEIYSLGGQSSVGLSFHEPRNTYLSVTSPQINILEAARKLNPEIRIFLAASTDCFGDTGPSKSADETSELRPSSPYAIGKSSAVGLTKMYRDIYGVKACCGFLSNHESVLRGEGFVVPKILKRVNEIASGRKDMKIQLGRSDIKRHWGLASDYVKAMHKMLECYTGRDYIIASDQYFSLEDLALSIARAAGLGYNSELIETTAEKRAFDIINIHVNPSRIQVDLGWVCNRPLTEVASTLVSDQLFPTKT